MAIQTQGFGGVVDEVDSDWRSRRVSIYPRHLNSGGIYTVRMTTGVLAAALAANAMVAGIREGAAPSRNIYIMRIQASFSWVIAATGSQQFGFYLERFSAANPTGGSAYVPMRLDTTYPATEAQDIRASLTAALSVSSLVFDGNAVPIMGWTSVAIGTGVLDMPVLWDASEGGPIRLRAGEGIALRNLILWPAAGTGVLTMRWTWEER
jgi:hypothetical protein